MEKLAFIIILLISITSCTSKSSQSEIAAASDSIPEGAISFEYDEKMMKMIIFEGTMNDSVNLKIIFDTGWTSIATSDSLKPHNINESYIKIPTSVKMCNWEHTYNAIEYFPQNNPLIQLFGSNTCIIDWAIFENRIIEISYKDKYIRELNNTSGLEDYDSVKIKRENLCLVIPVCVSYKGKKIEEFAIIDTGSNSCISFPNDVASKYEISIDKADRVGGATMAMGKMSGFSIAADSIMVGNSHLKGNVGFSSHKREYGLLGNRFLENFDIVLDLKNYNLYMKGIE